MPQPDRLDFSLPADHVCVITDDQSLTTVKLAQSLLQQGWQVLVLRFPACLLPQPSLLPDSVPQVVLDDLSEDHLKSQLNQITDTYGAIGAFIHLNPRLADSSTVSLSDLNPDRAIVKQVFLIAKHLKKSLSQATPIGRRCFLTVARLDGAFGLSQTLDFSAISAGLFGLTKTLNAEWDSAFCRAIDLSPRLEPEQSVQAILAELHDPNRCLTEVAYGDEGRTTLVAEVV